MDTDGIRFVDDILGTFISPLAGCACSISGEVNMVTDILVVVIVRPPVD